MFDLNSITPSDRFEFAYNLSTGDLYDDEQRELLYGNYLLNKTLKTTLKLTKFLGAGQNGGAWLLSDNKTVVKFSWDESEAVASSWLIGKQNNYLVNVYDVKGVTFSKNPLDPFYVISQEYLPDSLEKNKNLILQAHIINQLFLKTDIVPELIEQRRLMKDSSIFRRIKRFFHQSTFQKTLEKVVNKIGFGKNKNFSSYKPPNKKTIKIGGLEIPIDHKAINTSSHDIEQVTKQLLPLLVSHLGDSMKVEEFFHETLNEFDNILHELYENRIVYLDYHFGNFRIKNGHLCLIDFGMSESPRKTLHTITESYARKNCKIIKR